MEAEERDTLTERSNALRIELKVWEKEFAAAHNGQKASRDDIKNNPKIAAKYKEYNNTRDLLSGKIKQAAPPPPLGQTPRKRKHEDEPRQEAKRLQIIQTPSKNTIRPWEVDPYDSPSMVRNLFTPTKKTAIGPTPQKDGQALGLFDLLWEDPSPSKTGEGKDLITQGSIQATPRKSTALGDPTSAKYRRTPGSVSKRFTLAAFATPLKNRNSNGIGSKTPSSVSKLHFSTPSFLKRDNPKFPMSKVNENDDNLTLSPDLVRIPRKPLMRGLSSLLAGLRKMEDEALDDDLEALREMENEMAGGPQPLGESVQVEDSQSRFPLGGFDDDAKYDSEPDEVKNPTLGRDGQPLKVYKKKGQKRTTRRVNMKPIRSKPVSAPMQEVPTDDELAGDAQGTNEIVPDTQVNDFAAFENDARNFDSDSQSEYTASEGGTRYRRPNQGKKKDKNANKDGRVKKAARKVTALASQNFKRLKLRNSGAKGGVAHNSRFRRKR